MLDEYHRRLSRNAEQFVSNTQPCPWILRDLVKTPGQALFILLTETFLLGMMVGKFLA